MTYQFKIQLKNISGPTVWRRVLVPAHFTFWQFHQIIQVTFGWFNEHLFQFSPNGYASYPIIKIIDPEFDSGFSRDEVIDPENITLERIFLIYNKFTYIYDFGDDWKHDITLEKILDDILLHARCIKGQGACPPEDCGGPYGYASLKEILEDKKHPEHKEWKKWLGLKAKEVWDAEAFDLNEANEILPQITNSIEKKIT